MAETWRLPLNSFRNKGINQRNHRAAEPSNTLLSLPLLQLYTKCKYSYDLLLNTCLTLKWTAIKNPCMLFRSIRRQCRSHWLVVWETYLLYISPLSRLFFFFFNFLSDNWAIWLWTVKIDAASHPRLGYALLACRAICSSVESMRSFGIPHTALQEHMSSSCSQTGNTQHNHPER